MELPVAASYSTAATNGAATASVSASTSADPAVPSTSAESEVTTNAKSVSTPIVLTVKTPLERLTEAVEKNPLDFTSWVSLLALVESDTGAQRETVESTYDRFLAEFPLCFGYWNKYALYEYGLGSKLTADGTTTVATPDEARQKAREIYERGVEAVKHSVDMWLKYCEYLIHTLQSPVEDTRAALESAVAACGADPVAGPLWELYIQLETMNNDMVRLNHVFKRIMKQPLRNLEEFWEKYNQFVLVQSLQTLATVKEQKALTQDEDEIMDEGLLRVKIVNAVEAAKKKSAEDISCRQAFEAGIDRSYFHVTPVTDAALKNWHSYLDFEEASGDDTRCETLYERCLIPCANYEEIWLRYAAWQDKVHGFEAANAVFQRAVTIFLKYRASIYLEYATFLESHDKLQEAKDTYMKVLEEVAPKLVEAFLRYCNFERRRGELETAKSWYERGMEAVEDQAEVYVHVATAYATFLSKSVGDGALAHAVFERAVEKHGESLLLWLNFVHFELSAGATNKERVARVAHVYERALAFTCSLSTDEKNDLWFQYVDFMENYGESVAQVREVKDKETAWKRENQQPLSRSIRVMTFPSSGASDYCSNVDPGTKRPRFTAPQTAATLSTPTTGSPAAASYYQGYQGYGAQTYGQAESTTPVAAATAVAAGGQQGYSQAQYGGYYQQH